MKYIFMKLLGLLCVALFLNGCNSENESSGVQTVDQTLVFIDPIVEEKGLKANYLNALNTLTLRNLIEVYYFGTYNENEDVVKTLPVDEIQFDYDSLILAFKTRNYQKLEEEKDISLIGYRPTSNQEGRANSKHQSMVLLLGQLHNEMLRKTADRNGFLDAATLDLENPEHIAIIEKEVNNLSLNKDDLIKIIDINFQALQVIIDEDTVFKASLNLYLGHDLIKLRLKNMADDDPKLAEVQEQLKYILGGKDSYKVYLEYFNQ